MRSLNFLVLMVVMTGLCVRTSMAQLTATDSLANFTVAGGVYSFDIYAARTGANAVRVGTSNLIVNTNRAGVNPIGMTLTNINPIYSGAPDHSADYDPMRIDSITGAANSGKIAVTIVFTGNNIGAGTLLPAGAGTRICTVNLPIIGPVQTANLTWDAINSGLTDSRSQPITNTFVGNNNSILPIQLSSFNAQVVQGGVRVSWTTLSETNNYGFHVERRPGTTGAWTNVSDLIAGHGTTLEPHSYTMVDNTIAQPGAYQYRLRQIDLDGTSHYVDPISIVLGLTDVAEVAPKVFALFQNYPNPFNPESVVKFSVENTGHASLTVYSILGQKVATLFDEVAEAGRYYKVRFGGQNLASGMYIYRLQSGTHTDVKKMLLMK